MTGPAANPSTRRAAVDTLRGLTIVAMVTVNNPGGGRGFRQLSHAAWNGCTFADLVFPAFLLTMGVSMAMALARSRERNEGLRTLWVRIVRRSVLLVAMGVALNALIPLTGGALRYPGVLQRIGLSYLVASLIVVALPLPGQVVAGGAVLLGYAAVLTRVSVGGIGAGVLTPQQSVDGWVDRMVFGQAHLYRHLRYDPEGLVSTGGAVATVLLGYWAGEWLRRRPRTSMTSLALAVAAVGALAVGWWWGQYLPLNKRLWTPPYVLWTAGWVVLMLALLWELMEVRGWRWLRHPWAALGANALVLYVGTELSDRVLGLIKVGRPGHRVTLHAWTFDHGIAPRFSGATASVAWSVVFVALWCAISAALYHRKVFLRL